MIGPAHHTDAIEQAKFLALTQDEQLLQIWLNGRETNGNVAEAFRQIKDNLNAVPADQHRMMWFAFRAFCVLGPLSYAALLGYMISRLG